MEIYNGCVKLRAIEKEDFELLLRMVNSPSIEDAIVGWAFPISSDEQKKWMENYHNTNSNVKLVIECSNGKAIGLISLTNIDWKNRTALLEYKTDAPKEYRMRNDTIDAVNGILNWAFNELGLHCITAEIQEDNTFSKKLIRKAGFVEEGVLRDRCFKHGKFHNVISYSLLAEEFQQNVKKLGGGNTKIQCVLLLFPVQLYCGLNR